MKVSAQRTTRAKGAPDEVYKAIKEASKSNKDIKALVKDIFYDEAEDCFVVSEVSRDETGEMVSGEGVAMVFSRHAIGQLLKILGINAKYWLKCPEFLKKSNFEYWSNLAKKDVLLRTSLDADGERQVDGIQSADIYTVIDIVDMMKGLSENLPSDEVIEVHMEGRDMYGKILNDKNSFTGPNDEDLKIGFHVYNSEVGRGSAVVESLIYNSVDDTGIITKGWGGYRQPHRFKPTDEAIEEMNDTISAMGSNLQGIIKNVQDLKNVKISQPGVMIENLVNSTKPLVNKKQKEILEAVLEETGVESLWDIMNCFARAGADPALNMEERTAMMRIAGNILHKAKTSMKVYSK
jgi:hypothetical protein